MNCMITEPTRKALYGIVQANVQPAILLARDLLLLYWPELAPARQIVRICAATGPFGDPALPTTVVWDRGVVIHDGEASIAGGVVAGRRKRCLQHRGSHTAALGLQQLCGQRVRLVAWQTKVRTRLQEHAVPF
jgi:hypothetical protein